MGRNFTSKDNKTNSGSQPGLLIPFAGRQHTPGKLYPGPPLGSYTRFNGNSLHLTSFSQITLSSMTTAIGDKLPAGSDLSASKKTEDAVIIEDNLENIENIEDNKKKREEERGQ